MDKVLINELELEMRIGCSAEERALAQKVVLDIQIKVKEWCGGDLSQTVCYARVAEVMQSFVRNTQWVLLEDFLQDSFELIYENFPQAIEAKILAKKFVVADTKWCGVEMKRSRPKAKI